MDTFDHFIGHSQFQCDVIKLGKEKRGGRKTSNKEKGELRNF